MRNLTITILLLLLHSHLMAQSEVTKYVELAIANNPVVKAAEAKHKASKELAEQAKGLPDPNIGLGVFTQSVETRVGPQRAMASVSQSFPWFNTLKSKSALASENSKVQFQKVIDEMLRLEMEVKSIYQELFYLHKAQQITSENLRLLQSFKELARVNFESGKTAFADVLLAEMEEKEVANSFRQLEDRQVYLIKKFRNLLNDDSDEPLTFPKENWIESLSSNKQAMVDSLQRVNPKVRAAAIDLESQQYAMNLARLSGKPSLTVGASYINVGEREGGVILPDNGKDAFVLPQIGLTIPINRNRVKAKQREVEHNTESKQHTLAARINELETVLEMHIRDFADAERRVLVYQDLADLAERSLSLLQAEFTTGEEEFSELLQMESKQLSYQLAGERAKVDQNIASYNINYLIGNSDYIKSIR